MPLRPGFISYRRQLLQQSSPKRKPPKRSAVATWNLRGFGRDGWGNNSWLKFRMLTKMAQSRGWRAVLLTDCYSTVSVPGGGGCSGEGPSPLIVSLSCPGAPGQREWLNARRIGLRFVYMYIYVAQYATNTWQKLTRRDENPGMSSAVQVCLPVPQKSQRFLGKIDMMS